jgi:hypothetical protein
MKLNGRAWRRLKQIVGNIAGYFKPVQTDTEVSGPFERLVRFLGTHVHTTIKWPHKKIWLSRGLSTCNEESALRGPQQSPHELDLENLTPLVARVFLRSILREALLERNEDGKSQNRCKLGEKERILKMIEKAEVVSKNEATPLSAEKILKLLA